MRIYADDSVTAMLASAAPTKEAIAREASALIGEPCVVKVREAEQAEEEADASGVNEILDNARKQGIEVTEF